MPIQTATTGNLENAQRIAIAKCQQTIEFDAVCENLVQKLTLAPGEKSITWPKVGQMTASSVADGVDLVNSQDIGLTSSELTAGRVALKVILTDTLVRQFNEDIMKVVGVQMGNAMSRKMEKDIIALFASLNSASIYGADNKYLTMTNAMACVNNARGIPLQSPVYCVHHPHAIYSMIAALAVTPSATYPISEPAWQVLQKFYKYSFDGVDFFASGNIEKISGYDSAYGAIFSRMAMAVVNEIGLTTANERDESLFATEVIVSRVYGAVETDDTQGVAMQYERGTATTTN